MLVSRINNVNGIHVSPFTLQRLFSVFAWGRNVEGQCGVETDPTFVSRPTVLLDLLDAPVVSLYAGKLSSAAVLSTGEVCTWGCGKAGKLGHGNAEQARSPARVESLIGRASISAASLGDQHSLFLDSHGALWSCGENKEGQCGRASTSAALTQQRQRLMELLKAQEGTVNLRSRDMARWSSQLKKFLDREGRWGPQQVASPFNYLIQKSGSSGRHQLSLGGGSSGSPIAGSLSFLYGGMDMEGHINATGMHAGSSYVPARVGTEHLPFTAWSSNVPFVQDMYSGGLADERVVDVSASRFYSAVVTDKGEVWSFGGDPYGNLGVDSSLESGPQKLNPELATAIQDYGGAVQVAAGGAFCMCLTAAGKVFVWGRLGGNAMANALELPTGSRQVVKEVLGLPPIKSIAAGQQHGLLTDGRHVWTIGRWLLASGEEAGFARWESPELVLNRGPDKDEITRVGAGPLASAAVTGDGDLYLWGRVLDQYHVEGLCRRQQNEYIAEDVNWEWGGFGASTPTRVPGLPKVKDVAIGGWHMLVLTD